MLAEPRRGTVDPLRLEPVEMPTVSKTALKSRPQARGRTAPPDEILARLKSAFRKRHWA